jgi:hypothetical protein
MNRLHFFFLGMFFSLTLAGLPMLSHAQTNKLEYFHVVTGSASKGGEQVYRTNFIEDQVLDPDGEKKISIELEVTFYTGYSFAADADLTSRTARYTLERIGAPDKAGNYPVIMWKLDKTEGEDLLKGRLQKTVKMTLNPERYIVLRFTDEDSLELESDRVETDPYEDW